MALIVLALGLAACTRPATDASTTTTTYVPPSGSSLGLLPADPALHTRIERSPRSAVAGQTFVVTVAVTNDSSATIDLNSGVRCGAQLYVSVANGSVPPAPVPGANLDECLITKMLLPPGTSRWQVRVFTAPATCMRMAKPTPPPPCPAEHVAPYPPGRYALVLVGINLALPEPPLEYVNIVSPRPSTP